MPSNACRSLWHPPTWLITRQRVLDAGAVGALHGHSGDRTP